MDLHSYLDARGEKQAPFAARADVPQSVVNRAYKGLGCPSGLYLHRMIEASKDEPAPGGVILTLSDLVASSTRNQHRKRRRARGSSAAGDAA